MKTIILFFLVAVYTIGFYALLYFTKIKKHIKELFGRIGPFFEDDPDEDAWMQQY